MTDAGTGAMSEAVIAGGVAGAAAEPIGGGLRPVTSLDDPRAIQILSTEHWSLLSARSLAYNEAFTRGGMFLGFLSTSFVGLALVANAIAIGRDFLLVTALVLAFDLVIGLTTYVRIQMANFEDYRTVYGMARIRHGYTEVAPVLAPYFTTGINDDLEGVMLTYGSPSTRLFGLAYGVTTSGGMIGLIVSMLAGVLALVVALLLDVSMASAVVAGAVAGALVFVVVFVATHRFYAAKPGSLETRFPTPRPGSETDAG
jgi:hypothetical protein